MSLKDKILDERLKGHCCSETVMSIYLGEAGKENPDLVKVMGAYCGGMDGTQTCGSLAAACCAIVDACESKEKAKPLVLDFMELFHEKFEGLTCAEILQGDNSKRQTLCPVIIEETCYELIEMLEDNSLL